MGEVKFTTTEADHEILRNAARLAAVPVATWVRTTAIEAARRKMPKPEAAPKLTAKEVREARQIAENAAARKALHESRYAATLEGIEAGYHDCDLATYIERHSHSTLAGVAEYTQAFAAWCREHGHIKGE